MESAGKGDKTPGEKEAKKERKTGHNPEECLVCTTVFDEKVLQPRTLPCGHTLCTLCVNKRKQQGHVTCPECCVSHAVPEGGQFPVCYALEALIRRMRDGEAAAADSPPASAKTGIEAAAAAGQKEAAGLSRKMLSFLQEQEASVGAAITAYQEVQEQLEKHQTTLRGWDEQQQQLEDRLHDLLHQSRSARELVRQEESHAAVMKEEAKEGEQQLQAANKAPRTPATDKEARLAIVEVFRLTAEAEQVLEEYRISFSNIKTATTVRKVTEASAAALEASQAVQAAMEAFQAVKAALEIYPSVFGGESMFQSCPACTIETPNLRAEDIRWPTKTARRLLEAGRVFGVHEVEGQSRYARMSLEAGRVYLHTLREGPLPPGACTVQMSDLVPSSLPCVVFLDLSWPVNAQRRVYIRLSPNTPRGRQAVLLCTGLRGPSYAGTCFFDVGRNGMSQECSYVMGGDYESNDGKGGAALLPDLHEGMYRESGSAGAVRGMGWWQNDQAHGSVFIIATKDIYRDTPYGGVYGEVVMGLDTVVVAARHTPITEVIVQDCGVVL